MIPQWWSWLLTFMGAGSLFIAGRTKYGWLIALGTQVVWLVYALATAQYGFLFSVMLYSGVYISNYRKQSRQLKDEEDD